MVSVCPCKTSKRFTLYKLVPESHFFLSSTSSTNFIAFHRPNSFLFFTRPLFFALASWRSFAVRPSQHPCNVASVGFPWCGIRNGFHTKTEDRTTAGGKAYKNLTFSKHVQCLGCLPGASPAPAVAPPHSRWCLKSQTEKHLDAFR